MFLLFFLDESLQGFVYGRLLSDLPVYRHQTVKKTPVLDNGALLE